MQQNFSLFDLNNEMWTYVDNWMPLEKDIVFKHVKGAILVPVSSFYNVPANLSLDSFILSTKKCYNSDEVRGHICQYLNYFEKFYDIDHELLVLFYRIKCMIDYGVVCTNGEVHPYPEYCFINDIKTQILSDRMYEKVGKMVQENYQLNLVYRNKNNEGLQYTDTHGKYLMEISMFMNILIPLICHFMYKKKMTDGVDEFVIGIFSLLFDRYKDVDLTAKLYETTYTTMMRHYKTNTQLWNMCKIRGMDPISNSDDALKIIITQVMPKYRYDANMITYNFASIQNAIKYNIGIGYEYDYIKLSASKRDGEDNTSEFDKFEAYLIKSNEALFLQNKFNCAKTMQNITNRFGPFDDDEIDFYYRELSKGGKIVINAFQFKLISNLFFGMFGDDMSIKTINARDYIKLIIAARRLLESNNMIQLPYIISSRVVRIITKNTINKKEMSKLESSELFESVRLKYRNPKIEKTILSDIAIILSSEFEFIDYHNRELNGKKIEVSSDLILEEFLMYVCLI